MGLAPVNAWPLAWVSMIPLWGLLSWPQLSGRAAMVGAALWGVAYHGTALSWIVWWLKPLLAMDIPLAAGIVLAFFAWAFITVWGAAIGMTWMLLLRWVSRWYSSVHAGTADVRLAGWRLVLVGTALWCAVEWVWSRGPLYWTSLSYTQSPYNLAGLQWGQVSGPITVTAAIVAVNGLLAEAVWQKGRGQKSIWQKTSIKKISTSGLDSLRKGFGFSTGFNVGGAHVASVPVWSLRGAIALFLLFHLIGFGLYLRPLPETADQRLTVGLVQGNIPTSEKQSYQGVQTSRQVYLEGYESLVAAGADLVITPEGAISQTWNSFTQDQDLLMRAVIRNNVPLLLGTFAKQDLAQNKGPTMQSLLLLSPESSVVGRYNKVKLVPLGEYLPFEAVLRRIMGSLLPWSSLTPGRFDQQLTTPFGPMTAGICYESAFAGLFRQQVAQGGQLIFTSSNNDPYPPRQMMQHHAQDVMRAVETGRWAVRVTNTGISGVVDPQGRTLWLSAPGERVAHNASVYRRQGQTLYVRWGDWLTPLLLLISVFCVRSPSSHV
ncbi:MAG: apolipoprotein N-acyltransferase [Cyanobacteria bacterium J06573_11]